MKKNVGIIGNGFVGEAQAFAFAPVSNVLIYDIDPLKANATLDQVHKCDIIFVCVPTPMNANGSQDLTYINKVFDNAKEDPIYVIKSTVLPGTTNSIQYNYPNIKVVFSPEFLSERTAKLDMILTDGDKLFITFSSIFSVNELKIPSYPWLSSINFFCE